MKVKTNSKRSEVQKFRHKNTFVIATHRPCDMLQGDSFPSTPGWSRTCISGWAFRSYCKKLQLKALRLGGFGVIVRSSARRIELVTTRDLYIGTRASMLPLRTSTSRSGLPDSKSLFSGLASADKPAIHVCFPGHA